MIMLNRLNPVKCCFTAISPKAKLFNWVNWFFYVQTAEEKTAFQKPEKIYSQRKSPDSPGSFGHQGTREIS